MLTYVNFYCSGHFLHTFVMKLKVMNRNIFSKISIAAIASLTLLAIVQCYWLAIMLNDQENDFKRRVESAAYKSVYKIFRMGAIPGIENAEILNLDLEEFNLHFSANLLELDITEPYFANIIDNHSNMVLMRYGSRDSIGKDYMKSRIVIDDDNNYILELIMHIPYDNFWKSMKWLLISSIAIVVLLAALLFYIVRTLFRQRTLDEMRRDFTRNITHELKTPIAVASTAADALKNHSAEDNPERRRRYLDIIAVQLEQLSGMTEKILSISVEGKEDVISREKLDITNLVTEVISDFDNIGASLVLNSNEKVEIEGDRFHLKNVITTIIDNSIKYSEEKPYICISVESSNGKAVVTVKDNGIGISRENMKHIFEKFYRVPQGDLHNSRGYGIGLYYAKRIIEAHGGTISVESKLGKGTKVTLEIPE